MKYTSTRGGVSGVSFEEVLFSGYAPDGGLFVPEVIPKLEASTLKEWKQMKLSYPQVVQNIARLYISNTEVSDSELSTAVTRAYAKFDTSEIIPITKLDNPDGSEFIVAELYHGPTKSFKDLAMSLVGQLLQLFMEKRKGHITILVGTTGDTGSAAIEAVTGLKNVDIIVLYPKGMVSPVQELQMRSATGSNVHLILGEGTSDDLDVPIEKSFPAPNLTSINSLNWARVMIQISHFVYLHLIDEREGPTDIIVPTGAGGSITGGVYGKLMGVPLTLHVASNENVCVHDFISNGILNMGMDAIPTPASAMDVCNPYNLERILFLASDSATVKSLVATREKHTIEPTVRARIESLVQGSMSVDSQSIYAMMKLIWDTHAYVICPHTATAFKYASQNFKGKGKRCYILSTASPAKFPDSTVKAGIPSDKWDSHKLLNSLNLLPLKTPKLMERGKDWLKMLKEEIELIKTTVVQT